MSNRRFQMERFLHGKNHHKRGTGRARPHLRAFRQSTGDDSGYAKVDLHNLALYAAKNRIKEEIRDAKLTEDEASSSSMVSMEAQQSEIGCVVFP